MPSLTYAIINIGLTNNYESFDRKHDFLLEYKLYI